MRVDINCHAARNDVNVGVSLSKADLKILREYLDQETITTQDVGDWVAEAVQVAWIGVGLTLGDEAWDE